ncbi:hypothetical protein Talka_00458 [Tepidimonas alkaliphilus]|uniref:Ubiquinone biosynthesis protein UbiJ n=2 Tax=Tepidimonas alkaliphilus TaxID=2588942 RepID=A0A554WB60_9BURK|nr:hypothetical protein Talka_00458 [Tepidimonas alkaliphilus]
MPPFSWLPAPPAWLLDEARNRLVLLLNHLLQQEPEAQQRLRRYAGRCIVVRAPGLLPAAWAQVGDEPLRLQISPAGLWMQAPMNVAPDLTLTLQPASPAVWLRQALAGQRPAASIAGDVQLAAEVAWLIDHVRWDVEEDLARLLGDAAAHTLVGWGRACAEALRAHVLPGVRAWAQRAAAWRASKPSHTGDGAAA